MVGDGSTSNPYQITTCAEFDSIRNNLSANYILMNDLNFGGYTFYTINDVFWSTLDGNNHTISNLVVNSSQVTKNPSLFTILYGAVKNITLYNCSINNTTYSNTALLCANLQENALLSNITLNKCTITTGNFGGGLLGTLKGGNIEYINIINTTLNCGSYSGMLMCGTDSSYNGKYIKQVQIQGNIYGTNATYVGGMAENIAGGYTVTDCKVDVAISANDYISTFANDMGSNNANVPSFQRCYSLGNITSKTQNSIYNFTENAFGSYSFQNCFYDISLLAFTPSSSIATGKVEADLKKQSTFTNYDFTNTWSISEGQSYPTLRYFLPHAKTGNIDVLSYINSLYILNNKNKNIAKDTTIYSNITNYTDSVTKSKQTINNIYTNSIDSSNEVSKICNKNISMYINTIILDIVRQLGNVLNVDVNMYSASNYISANISTSKYKDSTITIGNIYNICNKIVQKCVDSNVDISDIHMSCTYNKIKNKDVLSYINVLDSKDTIITKVNIDDVQAFLKVMSNCSSLTVEELETKLGITTHSNSLNVEEGL